MSLMSEMCPEQIRDIMLDCVADGVFTVDMERRITCFNRAAEKITGVARSEAIGRRCYDVLRGSRCEKECALRETIETGRPVVCQGCYIVNAEGRSIPISISTALLKDREGEVIGGVETFRDLSEIERLRKELERKYTFGDIVARSDAMRRVLEIIPRVAESLTTVLIEGESGTGKELMARAIHDLSPRREKPFVAINCSALPDTLLESELFGYKAGAFTDAKRDKPGRFEAAEGGTILLDEIGDVSPAMQAKLLRVLQERVFEPLGSVEPVRADVRVIAATNRDLSQRVREGAFRQDLYYRIKVIRLRLPPLRERRGDVPLLVEHFISKFNALQGKNITGVSQRTMLALMQYEYPGNVRELENIIEHAFVLCSGGLIDVGHLPPELHGGPAAGVSERVANVTLREMEAMHITETLRRHGGNRDAAAQALGIHRATLFRKIKALGIDVPADGA
ncbi:MAG TPA: PAS domain S-box protein [Planctomycetes bacterium]|nr:PAS domain S-box protein [Planctomycetota bacterium]